MCIRTAGLIYFFQDQYELALLQLKSLLSHRLSNEGGLNLPCLVE